MEFEWDEEKENENIRKHGISFRTAIHVFFDDYRIERHDDRFDYGEDRFIIIGVAFQDELFVVYTERDNTNRIISARRATKEERREYYDRKRNY